MTLATATRDARPSVRTVLLKGVDNRGFVFYTNYNSRKARDLAATGRRACCSTGGRSSVRSASTAAPKVSEESDAYFATRPLESRWSVYASRQSEVLDSRDALESRFNIARQTYGERVPRPVVGWVSNRSRRIRILAGPSEPAARPLWYVKETSGAWRRERLAP